MTLARPATPPRGWNTWNACRTRIDERLVLRNAHLLVDLGLADAGYDHLVVDDGWQAPERDERGRLVPDPVRFAGGMAELAEQVHALGLRFGLYASPGLRTCAMIYDAYPGSGLGSFNHEAEDLEQLVGWGIDMLKYDWCEASIGTGLDYREAFERMAALVAAAPREILLSISEYGRTLPWEWAPEIASMWRTTDDIGSSYASMITIAGLMRGLERHAGPGAWNDPDMLHVGNGEFDSTPHGLACNRTHLGLWAMMAAPLFLGTELSEISPELLALLTNPRMLAIQGDELGRPGRRIRHEHRGELWARELAGGGHAIAFAATDDAVELRIDGGTLWQDEYPCPLPCTGPWVDVWSGDEFTATHVAHHDLALLTCTCAPTPPSAVSPSTQGTPTHSTRTDASGTDTATAK